MPAILPILILLVLANGLFAMAETAAVSTRKARLRPLAKKGGAAARAVAIVEQPARFLAFVQFWLTLSVVAAGMVVGLGLARRLAPELARAAALAPVARPLAFVLAALLLSSFFVLFGELIPKRIGLAHPEKVMVFLARAVHVPTLLAGPFLRCLELAADAAAGVLRLHPRPAAEKVGEDEVRALVEEGLHAGVFQRAEKEMVEGVLALDQLRITAIMTPRPKIVFLNLDDPEDANWRKIVTSGHSYFPVYQNHRDQVVGMVSVKALWAHSAIGLPASLKNLLIPPLLVPETFTAIQLLEQFKKAGRHTAVVTDEFGAVQGLVTLIDVLEAIVGDLPETGRRNQPEARKRDDGSWLVDATLPTPDLKALLGLEAPLPQERDAEYQTAGGFVVTQFGRIPSEGDKFDWGGWRFEVVDMDRRRVDKLLVSRAPGPGGPAA